MLCIVGNKCDLTEKREVPYETGKNFATGVQAEYYETSALSNEGRQCRNFILKFHTIIMNSLPILFSSNFSLDLPSDINLILST